MKKELAFVILILISFAWSCASVPDVYAVSAKEPKSSANLNGVFYCLPKTQLMVSVQVQRSQKGLNAKYPNYAHLIGLKYESGNEFSIEKVSFKTTAVADQSQWYFVHVKPNLFKQYELSFEQSAEGIPNASTAAAEDVSVEIGVEVVKLAVDVLGLVSGIPTGAARISDKNQSVSSQKIFDISLVVDDSVASKLSKVPDDVKKLVEEYAHLNSKYNQLITNNSAHELESTTLKLMIESVNNRRLAIAEQFIGKSKKSTLTMQFVYDKSIYENKDISLFQFSKEEGVFPVSMPYNLLTEGKQSMLSIPQSFQAEKAPKTAEAFVLHLSKLSYTLKGDSVYNYEPYLEKNKRGSFCYRIPAQVNAYCSLNNEILKDTTVLMAQAGVIKQLPRKAGVFNTKYELKFDPVTGALTSIKINGDKNNAEKIAKAGEAGAEAIDKLESNEAERLKKEIELLELQKKLEELKNK